MKNWDKTILPNAVQSLKSRTSPNTTTTKKYVVQRKSVEVEDVVSPKGKTRRYITVKDMGRKAKRQDAYGTTKRQYKYVKWDASKANSNELHMSHLRKGSKDVVLRKQKVPGRCLLCPKQGMFVTPRLMEQHYVSVHHKSSRTFENIILLRCKCSEVRSRGSDKSTRNAHFHCTQCHKPCDFANQLAKHMVSKHDYEPEDVMSLLHLASKDK